MNGSAADGARFGRAYAKLRADTSVQFDLPGTVPPEPPSWLAPLIGFFRWMAPAFPFIFWGTIAVIVLAVLYAIVRNYTGLDWRWWRRGKASTAEPEWTPEAGAARALLAEAEALAAEGRYAEAARLLLLRSVEDIGRRLPAFLEPSLTARDIAGAAALPEAARPAFSSIARVVEVSAFGAQSVTADAWEACRAAYARFALPATWTPARG